MAVYCEVRIREQLAETWSPWFGGLRLTHPAPGGTLLSGVLPDQAGLHGLLERIRDLNLTLLAVTAAPTDSERRTS